MLNTIYIEYNFRIIPLQPASDIIIAELGEAGFENFMETDKGVSAYIKKKDWNKAILDDLQILSNPEFKITYKLIEIKQENWNAVWEQDFKAIHIGDQCVVRTPFHEVPKVEYDIVIEPKMSFGTGHHETTYMMLQLILGHDFRGKSVLDMGCGTGVLAILAGMKGATLVDAIDIDNACYVNTKENVVRNGHDQIKVYEGDAGLLVDQEYDIIIANINRNILLRDIPIYSNHLNRQGTLILSGFYLEDIPLISEKCVEMKLSFQENLEKNNWVAAVYRFS